MESKPNRVFWLSQSSISQDISQDCVNPICTTTQTIWITVLEKTGISVQKDMI